MARSSGFSQDGAYGSGCASGTSGGEAGYTAGPCGACAAVQRGIGRACTTETSSARGNLRTQADDHKVASHEWSSQRTRSGPRARTSQG